MNTKILIALFFLIFGISAGTCPTGSTCKGISGKTKQFAATGGCPKKYTCNANAVGSGCHCDFTGICLDGDGDCGDPVNEITHNTHP